MADVYFNGTTAHVREHRFPFRHERASLIGLTAKISKNGISAHVEFIDIFWRVLWKRSQSLKVLEFHLLPFKALKVLEFWLCP